MTTKGLKIGDRVLYDDGILHFDAIVVNITSTTKAHIKALYYVNELYNPGTCVNDYRKFMAILL